MLTAITMEFGIPSMIEADGIEGDPLDTLLLFKAQKSTGDYHTQMNSDTDEEQILEYFHEYDTLLLG